MPDAKDTVDPPKGGEGENGDGTEAGKNNGSSGEGQEGGKPTEPGKEGGTPPGGEDGEPPVRPRSPKDFIIDRKNKKIEKLQKKLDEDGGEEGEEGEEEVLPEDKQVIQNVVAQTLAPLIERDIKKAIEDEAEAFVKANPEFAPFKAKAIKWANHESRRNLPVSSVFYEIAGPELMKLGAKKAKEADDKNKENGAGGGSDRGGGGAVNPWSLSEQAFKDKQEEVRRKGQS